MAALTREEKEEANERQLAEIEFIQSAYSPDEAWTSNNNNATTIPPSDGRVVHRLLEMPITLTHHHHHHDTIIPVVKMELSLTMPMDYPVSENAILVAKTSLVSSPPNPSFVRKAALSAIPQLVDACQTTAAQVAGGEAVWSVLNRAQEWLDLEWGDLLDEHASSNNTKQQQSNTEEDDNIIIESNQRHASNNNATTILGRRIIYSHHIIANSKRKALNDLASQYKLGGYAKIGWPGVILIEGNESDCQSFVDEIKSMRWQHLSVRAEEQVNIEQKGDSIDLYRKLPMRFEELGEDDLSTLARYCREAGLEHLFLTCMKINDHRNASVEEQRLPNNDASDIETEAKKFTHGALIHVDHMNDGKGYRKWLRKACQTAGCSLLIKQFHTSICGDGTQLVSTSRASPSRPTIVVGLFGDESSVRQVLKRWRTSRVDVDSKNKPCLERMMTVIEEGGLVQNISCTDANSVINKSQNDEDELDCSFEDLEVIIGAIDKDWSNSLRQLLGPGN